MAKVKYAANRAVPLNPRSTTFGTLLRATRLGFRWWASRACYVRISDQGKHWLVELRPNSAEALSGSKTGQYRRLEDIDSLAKLSPVLAGVQSVDKTIYYLLDEFGLEVTTK